MKETTVLCRDRSVGHWVILSGLVMSLGWGLRGYIGGGPLGAMIPGAMVALVLCLMLGREEPDAAIAAAFGAVGIGLGGQETYGQTVGLSLVPETMAWGILGLALKGAVWGLAGGAILGMSLVRRDYSRFHLLTGLALLIAFTWLGWITVNSPRLIYFSNLLDKPREELWAGLLFSGIALLLWLARCAPTRVPHSFAIWGFFGGALGFGLGGLIQSVGRQHAPHLTRDYWKVMEFTFGFLFGAALAYAAWKNRKELLGNNPQMPAGHSLLLVPIAALAVLAMRDALPVRFEYTLWAVPLLFLAWTSQLAARQIGQTMTFAAFAADFAKSRPAWPQEPLWAGVVIASLLTGWYFLSPRTTAAHLLFLCLTSTGIALLKAYAPPYSGRTPDAVMATFVVLLFGSLWLAYSQKTAHATS